MTAARYLIPVGIIVVILAAVILLSSSPGEVAPTQTGTQSTPAPEETSRPPETTTKTTSSRPETASSPPPTTTPQAQPKESVNIFGVVINEEDVNNASIYGFDFVKNSSWRVLNASPIYSFDFSDDGELYLTDGRTIYRIDRSGRVYEVFKGGEGMEFLFIRLGPDGKIYFSMNGIYRIDEGGPVKVLDIDSAFIDENLNGYWDGQFDLDSKGTIYLSSGWSAESSIVAVKDGKVTPIVKKLKSVTGGLRYVEQLTLNLGGERVDLSGTLMFTDGASKVYFLDFSGEKPFLHFLTLPQLGSSFVWDLDLGPSRS